MMRDATDMNRAIRSAFGLVAEVDDEEAVESAADQAGGADGGAGGERHHERPDVNTLLRRASGRSWA
jgi:hypothetical protein